jgi:hypothetical protein
MGFRVARIVQDGEGNAKIRHGMQDFKVCTVSLLASDASGHNVCPRAYPIQLFRAKRAAGESLESIREDAHRKGLSLCSVVCVTSQSGRGRFDAITEIRANLTRWYVEDRASFRAHLMDELRAYVRNAGDSVVACRPDLDSDVPWERTVPEMFDLPIRYWDYTKDSRRLGRTPANYHLTYSVHDGMTALDWQRVYDTGSNIAVVFDSIWQPAGKAPYRKFGRLPKWYTDPNGYRWRVIDGDASDLRFLDDKNVCIGLRLKGRTWEKWFARWCGFAIKIPRALRGLFGRIHPSEVANAA